jgi:hypothetical protein
MVHGYLLVQEELHFGGANVIGYAFPRPISLYGLDTGKINPQLPVMLFMGVRTLKAEIRAFVLIQMGKVPTMFILAMIDINFEGVKNA